MTLTAALHGRMRLPAIAALLFIISVPDLVVAQCTSGIIGAMPSLNARPIEQLDAWLFEIRDHLAAHDAKHPDRPSAPFAINLIVHRSNDWLEQDLALVVKHRLPLIITSLGTRPAGRALAAGQSSLGCRRLSPSPRAAAVLASRHGGGEPNRAG